MTRIIEKIKARRSKRDKLARGRLSNKVTTTASSETTDESENGRQIDSMTRKFHEGWYFSFEFFPPKTEFGLDNLLARIERMSQMNPMFIDVTWGDSGSTSARSMELASFVQRYCGVDALLHLTCTGMTKEQIASILQQAKGNGVHNILALRGDPPRGKWGINDVSGGSCDRAIDLVKLIRKLHGDYFGICVAGFPEGHPSSEDESHELQHLKEKIDSGADFIITQFFYNVDIFHKYVIDCRKYGINCPIIPGILPIQSYNNFIRMTSFCGVSAPDGILVRLEPVKDDMEAVKQIGNEIAIEMATEILSVPFEEGGVDGVHFHTLNLERSVTTILTSLLSSEYHIIDGLLGDPNGPKQVIQKQLPWRQSAMTRRQKEDVRPINWANRPKSYVLRTDDWDEYPNGRWGDASSPAFGELSDLSHFYSFTLGSEEDHLDMLGHNPKSPGDIFEVFAKYVEGSIPYLPWCETPLQLESLVIKNELTALNRAGFLTINSQPSINGVPSNHKVFGWGGTGGYIYQKGYCECFVSPNNARRLVSMVRAHKSMNLYGVNNHDDELSVNVEEVGVTALTWGVFPCREIQQPTIFDPSTFLVWAKEAFSQWNTWLNLYEIGSESYELIESIRDSYYLIAIIDNEFIEDKDGGCLWKNLVKLNKLEL